MLERLIEHVMSLPLERTGELTHEDVALCVTWYNSYKGAPVEQDKLEAIPARAKQWLVTGPVETPLTEGRRCQPLLREVIQEALDGFVDDLGPDELDFLITADDLADRASDPHPYQRVRQLLAPFLDTMHARRGQVECVPGLPSLSGRMDFVIADDITEARPRTVRKFAGIIMPGQGPLFTTLGPLKILGSVPEDCFVAVEEGACIVNGFVLGKLAVRQYCEIRENVSGVVVTREGDIRARNIVDHAVVVAKRGSVYCRQALGPKLIFAGTRLQVAGNTVLGTYMAPQIEIGTEVCGGEVHASERILASHFRHSEGRPLSIVLRRGFSCEDYGEAPSAEARVLLGEAAQLRQRVRQLRELQRGIKRESDHYASCALLYLIGGDRVFKQVEQTGRDQRRLTFLDKIISGLYALTLVAESELSAAGKDPRHDKAQGKAPGHPRMAAVLAEIDEDMELLEKEGSLDRDLREAFDEIAETRTELISRAWDARRAIDILVRVRKRLSGWIRERRKLVARMEEEEAAMQKILGGKEMLARVQAEGATADVLRRVLEALRAKSGDTKLGERARSKFLHMAIRNLTMRLERSRRNQDVLQEAENNLARVCEQVHSEFQIVVHRDDATLDRGAEVQGQFDSGVRLFTDPFLVDQPSVSPESVFATPDSRGTTKTYARRLEGIIEVS